MNPQPHDHETRAQPLRYNHSPSFMLKAMSRATTRMNAQHIYFKNSVCQCLKFSPSALSLPIEQGRRTLDWWSTGPWQSTSRFKESIFERPTWSNSWWSPIKAKNIINFPSRSGFVSPSRWPSWARSSGWSTVQATTTRSTRKASDTSPSKYEALSNYYRGPMYVTDNPSPKRLIQGIQRRNSVNLSWHIIITRVIFLY